MISLTQPSVWVREATGWIKYISAESVPFFSTLLDRMLAAFGPEARLIMKGMRWRSPRELSHRVFQEIKNIQLLLHPPAMPDGAEGAIAPFPDAARAVDLCRGSAYAESVRRWAEEILEHRFPVLGLQLETGPKIHWRRDYLSGKETGTQYFRRIPYLDAARAGDHKIIWELNRHQHLVTLAQAWRLTGTNPCLDEIGRQLDSWLAENPFQRGINWASALEAAFRALSWMWVDHLAGSAMAADRRLRMRQGLWRHGCHLEANLSIYFSPNTHILGEAVALHALGCMFRGTARGKRWERLASRLVSAEMERQVQPDGSHFERSTYYHVYALDMFLFHATLAPVSDAYRSKLVKMAEYLNRIAEPSRLLPFIGDDDGGRFFHPFGPRAGFGAGTLAACGSFLERPEWIQDREHLFELAAWWMPALAAAAGTGVLPRPDSVCFPDSGLAVLQSGGHQVLLRTGGPGPFRGGHSHADALSVVARAGGRELLIDPGTFTYSGPERDRFRGTAAHNTIRINRLDQADPAGPFAWSGPPQVSIAEWRCAGNSDYLDVTCRSRGIVHRRRVLFLKPDLVFFLDEVQAHSRRFSVEQFWHAGVPVEARGARCFHLGDAATLLLTGDAELVQGGAFGWKSDAYGSKQKSPVMVCSGEAQDTISCGALLVFSRIEDELILTAGAEEIELALRSERRVSAKFALPKN